MLDKNLEIEFKALLTKEQYDSILELFKDVQPYVQVNYYFDKRDGSLIANRNSLRVRFKNNSYEFTLKQPAEVGLNEYNEIIDEEKFEKLKNGIPFESSILDILKKNGTTQEELVPFYSLETTRYDLPYKGGLLSLDSNIYLDVHDYELEYEAEDYDQGLEIYKELLGNYGIKYQGNVKGKRTRVQIRIQELYGDH